ncbi:hypothetical protein GCM10028818_00020 [Spirosoma horti]
MSRNTKLTSNSSETPKPYSHKSPRRFKRVVPFERIDLERVVSMQLNIIEPERIDIVMKQGTLKLKRTAILTKAELDKLNGGRTNA